MVYCSYGPLSSYHMWFLTLKLISVNPYNVGESLIKKYFICHNYHFNVTEYSEIIILPLLVLRVLKIKLNNSFTLIGHGISKL